MQTGPSEQQTGGNGWGYDVGQGSQSNELNAEWLDRVERIHELTASMSSVSVHDATRLQNDDAQRKVIALGASASDKEALVRITGFVNPAGAGSPTRDDARLVLALILEDMQARLHSKKLCLGTQRPSADCSGP